jgi:hypothetical protein
MAISNPLRGITPTIDPTPRLLPSATIDIGAGSGESKIDPALRPFLTEGLRQAQNLFLGERQPQFYQGQTYVSPSQATQDALAQQEAMARANSPILQQAQNAFMGGLTATSAASPLYQQIYGQAQQPMAGSNVYQQAAQGGFGNLATQQLQDIASGSFLQGSPFQQAAMQAATRPLEQQFSNQVLPSIASLYSKAGRYGSGAMQNALGTATEAQTRALGDITSNMANQQYMAERGLQQSALGQLAGVSQQDIANRFAGASGLGGLQQAQFGTQLQAAGGLAQTQATDLARQLQASAAAPSIYAQQYIPSQQLAQIGAAQEQIAQLPLQEQMNRFYFNQQLPAQQLQSYLSSIYATPMSSSQFAPQPQATSSRVGSVLGGAGLGYGIGNMIGGTGAFGTSAGTTGAVLGGLAGLLI